MEAVNEWAVPEIVTEPTDSSTDGRHMLNNTKNLLLNIPKSVPILLYPKNCTIRPGFADDCTINVTLSEVGPPASQLLILVSFVPANFIICLPAYSHTDSAREATSLHWRIQATRHTAAN